MYDAERHAFCSEFYTVEKSIEVVVRRGGESKTVRIDALRNGETGAFSTRAYIEEHVTLQPTYPQTGNKFDKKSEDFRVCVAWTDFPWTDRDSANSAIGQALGFLRERCEQRPSKSS